jgi:hypothetical protein
MASLRRGRYVNVAPVTTTILNCNPGPRDDMVPGKIESPPPGDSFWSRFFARSPLRACFTIPTGYEDEVGFHLGAPAVGEEQRNEAESA